MTVPSSVDAQLPRRRLFGLDFVDAADVDEVLPSVLAMGAQTRLAGKSGSPDALPIVVTPNVDHLVKLSKQPDGVAHEIVRRAQIVLPDGQPIVWSSRLLGAPLTARLPGSTLVASLTPVLAADRRRVVVVASSDVLAERIERESPSFGAVSAPHLRADDTVGMASFIGSVVAVATDQRAEFVFITLGHPKQELIAMGIVDAWPPDLPLPAILAVGQSFDMYFGLVKRAPRWMQRSGLEWFFRFVQEPRRLFRRYFVDDPAFVGIVAREWRARKRVERAV